MSFLKHCSSFFFLFLFEAESLTVLELKLDRLTREPRDPTVSSCSVSISPVPEFQGLHTWLLFHRSSYYAVQAAVELAGSGRPDPPVSVS